MLLQALGKASPLVTLLAFQYSVRTILLLFPCRIQIAKQAKDAKVISTLIHFPTIFPYFFLWFARCLVFLRLNL
jgi:hypothetical protein